jgi:hypothetical protein
MTITETWVYLVLLAIIVANYIAGRLVGARAARKDERSRCCYLCHQAIIQNYSGSVRRVWNAIDSGADLPLSEDEFFGPRRSDEPEVH